MILNSFRKIKIKLLTELENLRNFYLLHNYMIKRKYSNYSFIHESIGGYGTICTAIFNHGSQIDLGF